MPHLPCPAAPLRGVYHPSRLGVLRACRWFVGTVGRIIHEPDGDSHVDVAPAVGYGPYLDADNYSAQHGQLVTEIMPGQNLPLPFIGKRVAVFGTWVHDEEHGWNEIHPIWAIRYLDSGRTVQSLPVAPPVFAPDAGSGVGTSGKGALECDSSYVVSGGPCLKEAIGDYDCYGGGGDGPNYTPPGALIRVVGKDSFGLDADRDGIACE